ncbi:MAG: hypothetical protein ABI844_10150 [Saprospiraceae bacterium]
MEESKKESSKQLWLYTFVSLAVMIILLAVKPEWFWIALPFSATYLVKAFGVI